MPEQGSARLALPSRGGKEAWALRGMAHRAPGTTVHGCMSRGKPAPCCSSLPHNWCLATGTLTMMAFTMSLLLFLRARTAFARDTLACDMTSSMSFTSTPVSST